MPSTYTSNLGIELPADGELDGVWGDVVNDNMSIIDRATNGSVTLTLSGTSSTLTTSDGTLSDGQYKLLVLGGSPSGTHTITIAPSDAQKIYFVRNTTAQSVVFTQGSGGNVTVATGDSAIIYSDGAGAGAAVVNVSNDFAMSSVKITGGTIDGTTIGGTTPAAGSFTTLSASGDVTIADKIVHSGDTNTAIRFPAADTVTVETSGAERLRIDSSGNVGIGTTSPDTIFEVVGADPILTIRDVDTSTTTANATIRFAESGAGDTLNEYWDVGLSPISALAFSRMGTERMRIDSSGNVGIGASAPLAQLHVATNASGMGLIAGSGVRQLVESSGPAAIQIASGGTTNPAYIFMGLNGDPDATRIASQVGFTQISATGASDYLRFDTGGLNERMRIDSSGNVGIGTSSPSSRLEVFATAAASIPAAGAASSHAEIGVGAYGTLIGSLSSGLGYIQQQRTDGTATTYNLALQPNGGKVGIGTSSPAFALDVNGGTDNVVSILRSTDNLALQSFRDDTTGSDGFVMIGANGTNMVAYTQGSERLRIDSSGNVGIGTAAPAARLDVTGASINALQARFGNLANRGLEISTALVSSRNDAGSVLNARADGQAGTLIFQREGTESMRIDSSGNVGIGTTSPTARLTVIGADNSTQAVFGGALGTTSRGLRLALATDFANNDTVVYDAQYTDGGSNFGNHVFQTAGVERLRIDGSGNVGIGTSSPAQRLDVRSAAANAVQARFGFTSGRGLEISTALVSGTNDAGSVLNALGATAGTMIFQTDSTERMRIDSSGNVGIGTSVPSDYNASADNLVVGTTSGNNGITIAAGTASQGSLFFADGTANATEEAAGYLIYVHSDDSMRVGTANTERMRINSLGNVGIGTGSPVPIGASITTVEVAGAAGGGINLRRTTATTTNGYLAAISGEVRLSCIDALPLTFLTTNTERMRITSTGNVGIGTTSPSEELHIRAAVPTFRLEDSDTSAYTNLVFNTGSFAIDIDPTGAGSSSIFTVDIDASERMRIDASGNLLVGKTTTAFGTAGVRLNPNGEIIGTVNGGPILYVNRLTSDGNLVEFSQDTVTEGSISVSGTTVSYNGGHLSRWAQFPDNSRPEILKGTVMSNLDQMSQWGDEDNEQLNCVQVSTVEGDPDVAGVFVAWDSTDDGYNDILLAMTGDMVIRIGAGVTVARGDLLMSAGDGTAKPQGDDIVRSKTIAKVTSTHVSHTYADGSYAVPCVLMAC